VIAALLLAAAIQGIGYYQKAAYLYQTNTAVEVVAGKITAAAATDGTVVTQEIIDRVVAEENAATPNDQITLTAGSIASYASGGLGYGFERTSVTAATTGGQSQFIKAKHDAVADRESAYFFKATASYNVGVNVVNTGVLANPESPDPTPSATGTPSVTPTPEPEPSYINVPANYNWATTNAGPAQWRAVGSSSNGQYLIAGKYKGAVTVSKDGGSTWTPQTIPGRATGMWRAVAISDDGKTMAVTASDYYIYTTRDGGTTWTEATSSGEGYWWGISMSADGKKMIATDYGLALSPITGAATVGRVLTSVDSGVTWAPETELGTGKWRSAAISADGSTMVAGGRDGLGINVSTDGGVTWNKTLPSTTESFSGVDVSSDGQKIIAVTIGSTPGTETSGRVRYSSDRGQTWTESAIGSNWWVATSISADGQKIVASAHNDYVYASIDAGRSWTKQESLGVSQWPKIEMTADGKQVIAAQSAFSTYTELLYIGRLAE
jgi:photosystem II stability/assembly factor-like uncharacterized protein